MSTAEAIRTNSEVRELTGSKLFGYAFGTFGQMTPIGLFNAFSYQYYVFTVGLDPLFTAIGVFLGLFLFAVCSPIFGVIIDNKNPGKIGKRRPFLLAGMPMLFILMIIAWTPPLCPRDDPFYLPTAIYFWSICACLYTNQGLLVSAYLSMLAEQSTTNQNRMKVASLQGLFSILGTVMSIFLPIILQSRLEDPQNAFHTTESGRYLLDTMPWIGLMFGIAGVASFLFTFLSVDETFFAKAGVSLIKKQSIKESFQQIFVPTRDPQYRLWMGNAFFFNMSIRILIVILMPFLTFVLLLQQEQFIYFILAVIPFAGGGYILWAKTMRKKGLKTAYELSLLVSIVASFATLFFLVPMPQLPRLIIGICILGIAVSSLVGGYLFPNPIVSKLVDQAPIEIREHAAKNNKAIAGGYFGLYIFTYNISQSIANLILGFIYTGGNANNPILITLAMPISGIIVVFALLFLKKLNLGHDK